MIYELGQHIDDYEYSYWANRYLRDSSKARVISDVLLHFISVRMINSLSIRIGIWSVTLGCAVDDCLYRIDALVTVDINCNLKLILWYSSRIGLYLMVLTCKVEFQRSHAILIWLCWRAFPLLATLYPCSSCINITHNLRQLATIITISTVQPVV